MKLFGINEFAARFPNFLCGIASLSLLYFLGRKLYGHRFGILWVVSYGAAILPFFYFKSGIIDPWFNLFIFMGIAWFIFYLDPERKDRRIRNVILSAFFFGLAVLTKGPVAILIFVICFLVFLITRRFRISATAGHVILFILVLALTGGTWFLLQVLNGNVHILRDFIIYQIRLFSTYDAGHSGFFAYHLVVVLVGVFPASVIALKSFTKKSEQTDLRRIFRQWMYIMFWLVLILFSIVRTKIIHYSSLTYFPLTFLAAWVWEKWLDRKLEISSWQVILLLLIALILGGTATALPLVAMNPQWLTGKDLAFLDAFTRHALQADVHWSGTEWLIGVVMLAGATFSAIQILRRNPGGMIILHGVSLIFVSASILIFTGRIEGYTQRAAIEFYEGLKGRDVYVNTLGYKSYAHLFYFGKHPPEEPEKDDVQWLLDNETEKDAYFVMKVDKKQQILEKYPGLEVLYEKNGYVFTLKKAVPGHD
jgi:4-amino-4-deoxy-L-arabinose transferase-like glycosyltransferase